jgi:hypothetical protein
MLNEDYKDMLQALVNEKTREQRAEQRNLADAEALEALEALANSEPNVRA